VPCILALPQAGAQTDTVDVPSDIPPAIGHLNEAVDASVASGALSRTVFRLEPHGYYGLTGTITVPAGEHLTIIAQKPGKTQDSAPPQLVWSDTVNALNVAFIFRCFGNIALKNLWLLYARTNGEQMQVSLQIEDSPDTVRGQMALFDGVIFDYSGIPRDGGGAVSITAKHFKGSFRNCYFRNCIDQHFSYYGRALSFPYASIGWHSDSVTFENCTFANIGYVYEQESGNFADFVKFNHCTFLNVVMFPLESGWWKKLSVTNCIFVNTHMFGYIPAQYAQTEPPGGTIWIDSVSQFGFTATFTDQDRQILFANNSYLTEGWLRRWMNENPMSQRFLASGETAWVPVPQPMMNARTINFFEARDSYGEKTFPLMNRRDLYDSTDPGFRLPPSDTARIKTFLYHKWDSSQDFNWAYAPELSLQRVWPLTENLSYTNPTLVTAGLNGFPFGDLYRWWPEDYSRWEPQQDAENARITQWLDTGADPGAVSVEVLHGGEAPSRYALAQNYPNPFNPSTTIRYGLPNRAHVTLSVYNTLGQVVAILQNGEQEAGYHEVNFDGRGLSSGVYFYRMQTGSYVESKKLVLTK
jgi:hypothetical protein